MKILAISITIAGILLGVDAIKCNKCVDTRVESDSPSMAALFQSMLPYSTCDNKEPTPCGYWLDACGTTSVAVDLDFGSFTVKAIMDQKSCGSQSIDLGKECKRVEGILGNLLSGDLTCRIELCDTDGCN